MMSKGMVKIICIIMAALMILSVGAVVLQVIAVDENAVTAQTAVTETVEAAEEVVDAEFYG